MIKNRFAKIMAENRIRNISKISQETGLSRTTLTNLYHNREKAITYGTVEILCKYLGIKSTDIFEEEAL